MNSNLRTLPVWRCLQSGRRLVAAAAIASILPAASLFAQDDANKAVPSTGSSSSSLLARYPAGTIASVDAADRALADVEAQRSAIEAQFAKEERACFAKFFANSCVDEAKERRRVALGQLRSVEIEANTFKRRMRVVERDMALMEKHAEDESSSSARRGQEPANAPAATKNIENPARQAAPAKDKRKSADASQRVAQHEAKLRRLEAENHAKAQKRADNVAAYEKKLKESQERQRQVEVRKKEREQARANRDSSSPGQ